MISAHQGLCSSDYNTGAWCTTFSVPQTFDGTPANTSHEMPTIDTIPSHASADGKNVTPKEDVLDKITGLASSLLKRLTVRRRGAPNRSQPTTSGPSTPPRNNMQTEPEINTIRASPEEMRGPSAARSSSDALGLYHVDTNKLHSPPASPGKPPHPDLPSRRSGRSSTSPIPSNVALPLPRVHKRIIICCDGCVARENIPMSLSLTGVIFRTWQDGIVQRQRWRYSNILKLCKSSICE